MNDDKVYALHWTDDAGGGVERVYEDADHAGADCDLLNKHSTVKWYVDAVPLIRG